MNVVHSVDQNWFLLSGRVALFLVYTLKPSSVDENQLCLEGVAETPSEGEELPLVCVFSWMARCIPSSPGHNEP